jgi:2-keto-3-deoxy-L-fuconate dehydrogenase
MTLEVSTRLAGKCCLVTAAGAGIGRATALAYARAGAAVLATDIDTRALGSLTTEHPAIDTSVLDVTDLEQIAALIQAHPNIDVLFNCAGYVHAGDILHTEFSDWRRSFAINVDSMFHLSKAVIPGMVQRRRGSIINMSSVASSVKGVPNRLAYGASKAAVVGLTKAIAADYVASGLRCNAICPGTVRTPSLAQRVAALGGDHEAEWKTFAERQPMGRLGAAEEIAALAVYLGSDESAFTTGTIHVIDGGWSN